MERLQTLIQKLKQNNFDSALVTSKANVYYLSGHYTDPHERLVALYTGNDGESLFILPEMEKEDAIASGWKGDFLTYKDQDNPWTLFKEYLTKRNKTPDSIAIEKDDFSVSRLEQLQQTVPGAEIVDGTEILAGLRVIKDKKEYTILKQAADLADFGVKTGVEAIREGASEMEILAKIEFELKKQGVREMSFSTMVLSGKKTASPHGTPGQDKIEAGDLVLFDLGVVFGGYCSDITRTVAFKQIDPEQEKIYQTVLQAQEKAIDAALIGNAAGSMDQVAREHIASKGYGEYFTHRIGHGIGVDVHEYPSLTSENDLTLKEGMSFTLEPGIYVPGVGGVRIEDEIFLTKKGPELLTSYPKTLQIIE
ncbi:M24 family metallopeptidase [Sediminibacillus halophilus]|uniref:Xaa-Pro dipeptidase n=1 Tax=Sediminibacillus halophilus TaxID=482461 RepID=A0A1G9Y7G6_9BACI|nr:Xaa-Pro peptidase family protein [Sediminibacillus halophilus]SDN04950.1 Xaa-Pro dipeptidase [Sediminibacillus halophilus]